MTGRGGAGARLQHPVDAPPIARSHLERAIPIAPVLNVIVVGAIALATYAAITSRVYEAEGMHDSVTLVCGGAVIGMMFHARYILRLSWLSPTMVYLILFWMFHYGLTFTSVVAPAALSSLGERQLAWLGWPNVRLAMLISLLGVCGFLLAVGFAIDGEPVSSRPSPETLHDATLHAVGWAVMLAGLGIWSVLFYRHGGVELLGLSYQELRSVLPGSLFDFVQISQLGCLLAIAGAPPRQWIAPVAVWGSFACLLLVLGLRGQAMIPLVTFTVVLWARGVRLNRGVILVAALMAMLAMPAIGTFRRVGFSNRAQVDWMDVTPLGTFIELGGTLRAVAAYVDWIEQGDQFLLGASYWAPFDRHFVVWVVPGRERTPVEEDERIPSRHMTIREGSVGTSATGEAYFNFGPLGPFVYFGFVGLLFGWLHRRGSTTAYRCGLLGVVLLLFYWNIRGQWLTIPAQFAAGLALLAATRAIEAVRGSSES